MHSGFYKAPTRNPESKALPIHLRKSKQNIAKLFAQPSTFKASLAPVCVYYIWPKIFRISQPNYNMCQRFECYQKSIKLPKTVYKNVERIVINE